MVRITQLPESPPSKVKESIRSDRSDNESYLSLNLDWTMMLELNPDVFHSLQNIFQKGFVSKILPDKKNCWSSMVNRIYKRPIEAETEWNKPKRISSCGRNTLVNWVNHQLQTKLSDIGELCSGIHYCFLLDILAPNVIQKKKIKFEKNIDAYAYNFKLLEKSFSEMKIDKLIPKKLKEKNLKEILIFTNWFKSFYEANITDDIENQSPMNSGMYSASILNSSYDSSSDMMDRDYIPEVRNKSKSLSQYPTSNSSMNTSHSRHSHGDIQEIKYLRVLPRLNHNLDTEKYPSTDSESTSNISSRLIKPKRVGMYGRKTLINWIRNTLGIELNDLNQLSDGVIFCLIVNQLDPIALPRHKIKSKPDATGFLQNFRLLQSAFYQHKLNKVVRVNKLLGHNVKEILMFTNWLKAFQEQNLNQDDVKLSDSTNF